MKLENNVSNLALSSNIYDSGDSDPYPSLNNRIMHITQSKKSRRWHKCRTRVKLRKAGIELGGIVYISGYFTNSTLKKSIINLTSWKPSW
jgi:hypothetical protein